LAGKPPATVALQQKTRRIPIVFVGVTDPAATSIVERLDRPSGNVIGADEANPARQVGKDPSAKFWSGKVDGLRGPAFDRPIGLLIMAACTSNNSICFPLPASKWIVLCP
jgi:hypothetical protein